MPYVFDPNLEDDDEQNGAASGASEVKLSDGSSSNEESASAPQSVQDGKEMDTGSGYQNLDKYLKTNQSQQFGNQVLGKVQGTLDTAKQNQSQAADTFKSKVNQNSTPSSEQLNSALANPTEANPEEFQKWMNQTYQGPKSLAEDQGAWNKYWSGTNQAETNAKLLGDEAGRFTLLDSYYGRPQYNFGEKSLDNLLVQQSGLGKETRQLQNDAASLKSQGNQQAQNLQNLASQKAADVDTSRQATLKGYGDAKQGAEQAVEQSLSQAQSQRDANVQAARQGLSSGQLTQDQLDQLGLTEGQNIYNLDLNNYLSEGGQLSRNQVATDEERARINALADLAGFQQDYLGDKQSMGNDYSFDTSRFGQDAYSAQRQIEQAQPYLTKQNVYQALNKGNTQFFDSTPLSDNIGDNLNYIKQQRNSFRDAIQNQSAPDNTKQVWQQKVDALNDVLNNYNLYNDLNPNKTLSRG